ISGNIANNNNFGIKLYLSNNSKVSGNVANNNIDSGINLGETDNTNVSGNLVLNNGGAGIFLDDSNYIKILNNSVNHNNASGIGLGNTNNNGQLIQNNCSFNRFGIQLDSNCENNTIRGNFVNNNAEYGMNLMESGNNVIKENIVNNNGNMGINLEPKSSYNEIVDNTVNFNGWTGIHLQDNSTNNLLLSNNCSHNGNGINLRAPNNTISENYIEYNSGNGIYLWGADSIHNTLSNNITRNFINNNIYGIVLSDESSLNKFEGNRIIDNTGTGFLIDPGCNDNLIFNNTFINNINTNAEDNGNNNNWNSTTLGNYWDDYPGKDADDEGIGDTPYSISGTAGSQDNFPIWWDDPVITIISPVANSTHGSTAPTFTLSIEGVPVAMWYEIEETSDSFPITGLNGTIDQATWDALPEGVYKFWFYIQDSRDTLIARSVIITKKLPSEGIPGYNLIFLCAILSAVVAIIISRRTRKY
ncbi:MAG: right-handed parallel beta-helix repeat-containing protein, partial [Candidatus Hodarchaeales archaeon]